MMETPLSGDPWQDLAAGAESLGVPLTDEQIALFRQYADLLITANREFNLTAVRDLPGMVAKLFLDSLSILPPLADAGSLTGEALRRSPWKAVDVGSGAGIPGIPLQLVWPALQVTFVESVGKKTAFIRNVASRLRLSAIIATERAETLGRQPDHRERYDLVLARAVAEMPALVELTLPLVRVGGLAALPKGPRVHAELSAAQTAIKVMGGEVVNVVSLDVPGVSETRTLVILRKVRSTPPDYPRQPGTPAKRPIR